MTAVLALAALLAAAPPPAAPASEPPHAWFTPAELAPVFAGSLVRAKAAYDANRYAEAAAGFAHARAPEARYLRAVSLVELSRGDEAGIALAGLEQELPALADRVWWWRGRARELSSQPREALEAYARVPQGSLFFAQAQLARARVLRELGEADEALAALRPILSTPAPDEPTRGDPAAEALLLSGELRAARGEPVEAARARRDFLDCWAAHPLTGVAPACLVALRRLPGDAGRPPPVEDVVRHAESLVEANRNDAALRDLAPLLPGLPPAGPGEALSCRARFTAGKALRRTRQHTRAVEVLRPVAELCDEGGLRARAAYLLAQSALVLSPEEGIAAYRRMARDFPDHGLADDALFYAADQLARQGQADEARQVLSDLLTQHPATEFRAEALFRLAWMEKRAGRLDRAVEAFAKLEQEFRDRDPYEHARAGYWRARSLAARGQPADREEARAAFAALASRYPADYYGLLARARLAELAPGERFAQATLRLPPSPEQFRYDAGALAADRHFRAGVRLLRMGLPRAAAEELRAADRRPFAAGDHDAAPEPLLLLAELLDRADDHRAAHNLVRTAGRAALREKPEGQALRIWRIAYPPAFRGDIERWSGSAGVPADLLQGLMREESGLDPLVVSPAGAVGLTQLMLPTARQVARRLKLRPPTPVDLTRGPLNIRLGAAYLGQLLQRFEGSPALAAAAYNAGPNAVGRWLKAQGSLALDEFVEEIPLQETRGYVKRVLRSYGAYRLLYGTGGEPPIALSQKLPGQS
ncbi:lytic transglycosylase domain-containing protein [Anaeromyxobacter paludicola]|uniref:Murein transglycosylase n=1 Tax=Anaeromyxobacter paludicola TaxID=2918171 RepID=A0ABN6N6H4_9BACT|nr:transglycosylase SLT domain-containing protein [Anaeromyxobacter paludicola]BDG07537.1 murein transglycosylase [Anaeromyxobacter paludicola]